MWSEDDLRRIFSREHRQLLPDARPPHIEACFYPFANLSHTIRLRRGKIIARISDICRDAPPQILEAIAHILLAKLCGRKPQERRLKLYRAYVTYSSIKERIRSVRRSRCRKLKLEPKGKVYDLAEIFSDLNEKFFGGKLHVEQIGWSRYASERHLGHYDHVRDAIAISRRLDHTSVPRYFVEYIVYHEMLHALYDDEFSDGRRIVHHERFKADEAKFPYYDQARAFLAQMASRRVQRDLIDRATGSPACTPQRYSRRL